MLRNPYIFLIFTVIFFLTGKVISHDSENYFYLAGYVSVIFFFRALILRFTKKDALDVWFMRFYIRPFSNLFFSFALLGLSLLMPLLIISNDTIIKHLSISIFIALVLGVVKETIALLISAYFHSK
jgi:hypothetical protein